LLGLGISIVLIGLFVVFTGSKYKALSGHWQFTPFSGWQMANNAMYAYRYIDSVDRVPVPKRFEQIDKTVCHYLDTTRDYENFPVIMREASTVYMWDPHSPLQIFMQNQFKKDSTVGALKKWATMAPLYSEYGKFLVRQYPEEFFNHYLFPNLVRYYVPPVEFLEQYNTGVDSVQLIAKAWFGYKTNKVSSYFKSFSVQSLNWLPIMVGMMHVVFVLSFLSFIWFKSYQQYPVLFKGLLIAACLWVVNFGFSIFASPIALRFQLFPILVCLSFDFLLIEYLLKESVHPKVEKLKNGLIESEMVAVESASV
jgi:hypothetical protein